MVRHRLAFYDHHRMSYRDQPLYESNTVVGKFMLGFFMARDAGILWPGGEFAICLYSLDKPKWRGGKLQPPPLTPRVQVFLERNIGAFREFDRLVGLERLGSWSLHTRADLSRFLIAKGLRDDSDISLEQEEQEADDAQSDQQALSSGTN